MVGEVDRGHSHMYSLESQCPLNPAGPAGASVLIWPSDPGPVHLTRYIPVSPCWLSGPKSHVSTKIVEIVPNEYLFLFLHRD